MRSSFSATNSTAIGTIRSVRNPLFEAIVHEQSLTRHSEPIPKPDGYPLTGGTWSVVRDDLVPDFYSADRIGRGRGHRGSCGAIAIDTTRRSARW
jgi:hypothetical protein